MELYFKIRGGVADLTMLDDDYVWELRKRIDEAALPETIFAFDSFPINSGYVTVPDEEVGEFHRVMSRWHSELSPDTTAVRSAVRDTIGNLVDLSAPSDD